MAIERLATPLDNFTYRPSAKSGKGGFEKAPGKVLYNSWIPIIWHPFYVLNNGSVYLIITFFFLIFPAHFPKKSTPVG